MNKRIVLRGIFALGFSLLLSAGVHAQAFRTYLSRGGNDANPCSLVAPCRLLPAALAAVIDGGEIWMLDSANYNSGPVNVNKSVTILAIPGALGSVVALGGNAIDIATPFIKVALRNLVIVPFVGGGGTNGINMAAGAGLTVEKCLIANLPGSGIIASANNSSVLVMDSAIRGNTNHGLAVQNGARATVRRTTFSGNGGFGTLTQANMATTTTTDITDSTIDANGYGVAALSFATSAVVKVSVRNSQVTRNALYGLVAQSEPGGDLTTLSASNNVISNNNDGLVAVGTGAKLWASGNTVSDNNGTGLLNSSAILESASDNAVRNNGVDTTGVITAIPML